MSCYNIQPSISLSRTVVEMSHSELQPAVHVHIQRIELYWLKGLLVQRTCTLDMEIQGHNVW